MTRKVVGSLVNTVGFEIDKRSWSNLNKFAKRLSMLKTQMRGLSGGGRFSFSGGATGPSGASAASARRERSAATTADRTRAVRQRRHESHVDAFRARQRSEARESVIGEGRERTDTVRSGASRASANDVAQHARAVDQLNNSYRNTNMSTRTYNRSLNNLNRTLRSQSREVQTLSQRFLALRHQMFGLAIAGTAIAGMRKVVQIGQDFESAGTKMLMATGNTEDATEAMTLARVQSKRLGLDLLKTTDAFARLGIAADGSLSKAETNDLFISFAELATAANIPKVQMDRGMRAMEQMLNKGQLMAEEVKGQFAEAINKIVAYTRNGVLKTY